MAIEALVYHYKLHFKEPAMTSRGTYLDHDVWYLVLQDQEKGYRAVGECAPLPDLSPEYMQFRKAGSFPEASVAKAYGLLVAQEFARFVRAWAQLSPKGDHLSSEVELRAILSPEMQATPALCFALESVHQQWRRCQEVGAQGSNVWQLWPSAFSAGESGIPINGLIWMGNFEEMSARIASKLEQGFRCVKLKIGAIEFERELELLAAIRKRFSKDTLQLRVDANGAFSPEEAMEKLERLSAFDLHSIEQPIKQGQWQKMAELCAHSPLPIALDEELIGISSRAKREQLLFAIHPQYIVLKPSLHGGLSGTLEWIEEAQRLNICYWLTSALESNIGLNVLAQWIAKYEPKLPQGLGTGQLYTNNVPLPLQVKGDELWENDLKHCSELWTSFNKILREHAIVIAHFVI